MGEECPLPGSGIFQRMLLVSLQWIGGFARGATPLANGPRHCGQLSASAVVGDSRCPRACSPSTATSTNAINNLIRIMDRIKVKQRLIQQCYQCPDRSGASRTT